MSTAPELCPASRFEDNRGWFRPLWAVATPAPESVWAQDSVSFSRRGVVRGLHFQHPHGQAKLLTVLQGVIFDVAVDVRRGSPDFGRAFTCTLHDKRAAQLHIPAGFAHGFAVLSDSAMVHYRCSTLWSPADEKTLLWCDQALAIEWPIDASPILSEKDAVGRKLSSFGDDELPVYKD
jgi:dTDP-4-dehydrorhamnose 3,5-epimerase